MSTAPNYKKEKTNKKAGDAMINCTPDQHEIHIIVLVAGTTEPVNAGNHRAVSYANNDTKIYWDKDFVDGLENFKKQHRNFDIFNFHGWSGDNRAANRKIAGRYLANRLCGGGGEKAFYSGYKGKKVNFHLLGHSHGGNVINEMTQQIAALGSEWPQTWKIKSITYLSTPFFNKLHPVAKGDFIHKDARVLNATNKFDLTQRMLADFSLVTLRGGLLKLDTSEFIRLIKGITSDYDAIPLHLLNERNGWSLTSISHSNGILLYSTTVRLLNNVIKILNELLNLAAILNKPYSVPANSDIKGLTTTHKIFPDDALSQFKVVVNALIPQINEVLKALNDDIRITASNGDFSKANYVNALLRGGFPLVDALRNFLNIELSLNTPNGSIWDIVTRVIQNNIENYDNTYQNPKPQLQGSVLEGKLDVLDVTPYDSYNAAANKSNYDKFINAVERVETQYQKNPNAVNLREIIFMLLAHQPTAVGWAKKLEDAIFYINGVEYLTVGGMDKYLKQIRLLFENINNIVMSRHQGALEDASDTQPVEEIGQRGSLKYFLIESHSTSRRKLRAEVESFLKKVITQ